MSAARINLLRDVGVHVDEDVGTVLDMLKRNMGVEFSAAEKDGRSVEITGRPRCVDGPDQRSAERGGEAMAMARSHGVLKRKACALGKPDQTDTLGGNACCGDFLHQRGKGVERVRERRLVSRPGMHGVQSDVLTEQEPRSGGRRLARDL